MPIAYACAAGHAPGISAWPDAAPPEQKDRIYAGFERLRRELEQATLDELILFTSEHWTNFFLDHMSAFCVGRAESFSGPAEPWLKIDKARIGGDPALANVLLDRCYANDVEPAFADELQFDHGTMIPLWLLTPAMDLPVVPIVINTLAPPFPSARRCQALGRVVGEVARESGRRIGIVATGGMSHDPGGVNHGTIDTAFDRKFLAEMGRGDLGLLADYPTAALEGAGAGAVELLSWIALAGALQRFTGEIVAYEPVIPWATGIGLMSFRLQESV